MRILFVILFFLTLALASAPNAEAGCGGRGIFRQRAGKIFGGGLFHRSAARGACASCN